MVTNFKESLKIVPSEQEEKKRMELDAYKEFISEAIPGYISFMEALNHTINELQERLREKDVFNLGDVEYVILETSGQISVVPKPEKRALKIEDLNIKSEYEGLAFDLVLDGKVMSENLKLIGKDYRWLEKQTKEFGIKPEEALVVTINGDNSFYCQAKKRKKC